MLDDLVKAVIKMFEGKAIIAVLTVLGIPAFIYTWFTDLGAISFANAHIMDIGTWIDPAKTILLAIVSISLGLFALIRYAIKTIYASWEFWDKAKARYKKKTKISINDRKGL